MKRNPPSAMTLFSAVAALAFAGATAASADDQDRTANDVALGSYASFADPTAGGMIGQPVVAKNGIKVGKVSDLVIRKVDKVSYAVVSLESAAKSKEIVIPYQALKVGPRVTTLATNLTPGEMATLPKYEPDDFSPIRAPSKG